jgi:hypothetical protein
MVSRRKKMRKAKERNLSWSWPFSALPGVREWGESACRAGGWNAAKGL